MGVKIIDIAKAEVTSNNETIESLTNQNEILMSVIEQRRKETAKQADIQESKLIKKKQEIHNIYKTQKELELQLIEKDNKIRAISKTSTILQSKLIEKEKKIYDFNKTESKLIDKENEIRDLENKIQ